MARLTECCCSVSAATTETKDQRGKWDDEKQKRDDLNGRKIYTVTLATRNWFQRQ